MVFDIGAGLSEMGKGIAQTAQVYTLEQQRGELEKERILLADDLAGKRQEKEFEFKGKEGALNRTSAETITDKTVAGQIEGHKISAGATVSAASLAAAAHRDSAAMSLRGTMYTADKHLESTKLYTEAGEKKANIAAEAKTKAAEIVANARKNMQALLVPSEDALDSAANVYNATGAMPQLGYGGTAGRTAIIDLAAKKRKTMGMTDEQWQDSSNRAKFAGPAATQLQKQYSSAAAYSDTAEKNGEIVRELLDKGVGPTGLPIVDAWVQSGRRMVGDDDVAKFGAALYAYATENAKVMSGAMGNAPLSDAARREMEAVINKAMNKDQLMGVMAVMEAERANRMAGYQTEMNNLSNMMKGQPAGGAAHTQAATPSNPRPAPAQAPTAPPQAAPKTLPFTAGPGGQPALDPAILQDLKPGVPYRMPDGSTRFWDPGARQFKLTP